MKTRSLASITREMKKKTDEISRLRKEVNDLDNVLEKARVKRWAGKYMYIRMRCGYGWMYITPYGTGRGVVQTYFDSVEFQSSAYLEEKWLKRGTSIDKSEYDDKIRQLAKKAVGNLIK